MGWNYQAGTVRSRIPRVFGWLSIWHRILCAKGLAYHPAADCSWYSSMEGASNGFLVAARCTQSGDPTHGVCKIIMHFNVKNNKNPLELGLITTFSDKVTSWNWMEFDEKASGDRLLPNSERLLSFWPAGSCFTLAQRGLGSEFVRSTVGPTKSGRWSEHICNL